MVDFRHFSERSIKIIMLAQEEARRLGHNFVGREQLLTGLMGASNSASQLLRAAGLTLESIRAEVKKIIGQGSGFVAVEIPFTPRAKQVLEEAIDTAIRQRTAVEPEHILLAIASSPPGTASKVLENLGVNVEQLKQRVSQEVSKLPPRQQEDKAKTDTKDLLKEVPELPHRVEETRIPLTEEYKPLEGEPAISDKLKNAISVLVKNKYRGASRWSAIVTYRFTESGIKTRTRVRDDGGSPLMDYSEFEAIAIAEKLAAPQPEEK